MAVKTKQQRNIERLKTLAKSVGIDSNPLFQTTIDTYQLQLDVIDSIRTALAEEDALLVTKEYVKGRENQYSNPLLKELPRHCDSATKTADLLWKMIQTSDKTEDKIDGFEELLRRRAQL